MCVCVCVCVCVCGDPGCVQRGVGVEMCPAEPPHDLENEGGGCERLGGVSRSCRPLRRSRGEPPCGLLEGCVCVYPEGYGSGGVSS